MKIGIINSGGDVPGINAVIASAVKTGQKYGDTFVGFIKGWEGLLNPMDYIDLDLKTISSITNVGGTILHSTNKGRFAGKVGTGQVNVIPAEILAEAKANLDKLSIDAIMVIGGDGTLTAATSLIPLGVKMVGVPKTIDNDLSSTDRTFGYTTAVNTIVESLHKLRTTAESHERVFVVETMGRHVGWLALDGGLGGEAHAILIPEFPFSYQDLYQHVIETKKKHGYAIVVVAEGAIVEDEGLITQNHGQDSNKEVLLGGIGEKVARKLDQMSSGAFETRTMVLGHLQRGGSPDTQDIILSQAYGAAAIEALHAGEQGKMVALQGDSVNLVDIHEATKSLKRVNADCISYKTAKSLGIFLGK